jgi:N-hydroxyarylamine O-acetyltransferase
LVDKAVDDHGGRVHRLDRVRSAVTGDGWQLSRQTREGWEVMHTTDDLPVQPVDLAMGHHFTSTGPTSHFRTGLMVTGFDGEAHLAVTHETVTERRVGEPTEHRPLEDGELADLLDRMRVPLTDDERGRLLEVVAGFREEAS